MLKFSFGWLRLVLSRSQQFISGTPFNSVVTEWPLSYIIFRFSFVFFLLFCFAVKCRATAEVKKKFVFLFFYWNKGRAASKVKRSFCFCYCFKLKLNLIKSPRHPKPQSPWPPRQIHCPLIPLKFIFQSFYYFFYAN